MNLAFKRASFPIIDLLNNPRSVKFTSNWRNKHLDQVRSELKNKNKFTTKSKKALTQQAAIYFFSVFGKSSLFFFLFPLFI